MIDMRGIRAGAGQTAGLVPFMRLEKKIRSAGIWISHQ